MADTQNSKTTQTSAPLDAVIIEKGALDALLDRIKELEYLFDMDKDEAVSDRLYSTDEAREILRLSRSTLQTYRDKGILGFIQIGAKVLFRWSDLQNFLNHNKA